MIPVRLAALAALVSTLVCGPAAAEQLSVGQPLARFDKLVPSDRFYVRYTIKGQERSVIDLWRRTVSFETRDGKKAMHIAQRWDKPGADGYVSLQDAWFEPGTFRPLVHERRVTKGGQTHAAGYRFLPDKVVGETEMADNEHKDFVQPTELAAFNFETDMEFFQALPLAKGYEAKIYFYDPGRDPAGWYVFKVLGEDRIASADGRSIDCWVLTTDYNKPGQYQARFWLAKSTQVMLREETSNPDGTVLVKTLLNPEAA